MINFLKLVYNEQVKIFVRKSTWIMYIILAVLVIGSGVLEKTFGEDPKVYDETTWQAALEAENEKLLEEQADYEKRVAENNEDFIIPPDMDQYKKNNYYLENDIMPVKYGAWQFTFDNDVFLSFVSLFTIIIAAGIISNEYRWGTIKLLLIRPITRTKILFAKYVSVLLFSLITVSFLFIITFLTGTAIVGLEPGLNPQTIVYDFSETTRGVAISNEFNYLKYVSLATEVFASYGYQMVILVMMATFAFLVSTVFQSSSLAIGISIFLMFAGNSIMIFLKDYSWAKYILFANTDLSQYVNNNPMFKGMTLQFSMNVLIVYFIVFIVISWLVFTKRDVAGE